MEVTLLAQKVCNALIAYFPKKKEADMLQKLEVVRRIWAVFNAWDKNPATLDPSSFRLDDMEIVIQDIGVMDEWESTQHMQRDVANSLILTGESMTVHCARLPRLQRKVSYL